MIMKRNLVSQNINKVSFNYMKHDAYYNATPCSTYYRRVSIGYYISTLYNCTPTDQINSVLL